MKRPRHARPTLLEFEEHLHDLAPLEVKSPAVQWFIAECRRARDSEDALKKALAAFRAGRTL
jgi:hypothetical protein